MILAIGILATGMAAIAIALGVVLLGELWERRHAPPEVDPDRPLTMEEWCRTIEGEGRDE